MSATGAVELDQQGRDPAADLLAGRPRRGQRLALRVGQVLYPGLSGEQAEEIMQPQ